MPSRAQSLQVEAMRRRLVPTGPELDSAVALERTRRGMPPVAQGPSMPIASAGDNPELDAAVEQERMRRRVFTGGVQGAARSAFGLDNQAQVEPTGDIITDVGTALSNVPRSAANVVGGLANVITSPVQTLQGIGTALGGGLDIAMGKKDTARAKLSKQLMDELTRVFREPGKTLINDPVGAALDVAGLLTLGSTAVVPFAAKGGRVAGLAQKLARVSEFADPVNVVLKVGGKIANRSNLQSLGGKLTGTGAQSLDLAYEAGRQGGQRGLSFLDAKRGVTSLEDVSENVRKGVDLLKAERSRGFSEMTANAKITRAGGLDVDKIRRGIFDDLKNDLGVTVRRTNVDDLREAIEIDHDIIFPPNLKLRSNAKPRAQIEDLVNSTFQIKDPGDWQALHMVRQDLDDIMKGEFSNLLKKTRTDAVLAKARGRINNELRENVDGFAFANDTYAEASQELEKIVKSLSVKGGGPITETELTKLGNLLNTRTSGSLSIRQDALHAIETALSEVTGEPVSLAGELAGLRLANPETLGIRRATGGGGGLGAAIGAGIGASVGGGFGAVAGAALGKGAASLLGQATINNPRAVGSFFYSLGASAAWANRVFKFVKDIKEAIPPSEIRKGLTVAQAYELAQQRAESREKVKASLRPFGV